MIDWENTRLPNDMSKEEMLEAIFEIARVKAKQHSRQNKALFLSREDLEQEIAIKCITALPSFDASKSFGDRYKLFFYRCADNVVIDLKRRYVCYHKVPCKKCPEFDKAEKRRGCHDCKKYTNKNDCSMWRKYEKLNQSKFALGTLMGTVGGSSDKTEDMTETRTKDEPCSTSQEIKQIDLDDSIRESVGSKVFSIYEKLARNNFNVKKITQSELRTLRSAMERLYGKDGTE
jgi:hypothetical protein